MFDENDDWDTSSNSPPLKSVSKQLFCKVSEELESTGCHSSTRSQRKCIPPKVTSLPVMSRGFKGHNPPSSTSKLNTKMSKRLLGARFRWINEKLYTSTGEEAFKLFAESPELFSVYHEGFREQCSKWPRDPLDHVIKYVKGLPDTFIIADFGCGNARLALSVPNVVHSFDLVAVNDRVTACDMSNVPLPESSVDVCVFCLSLMNSNVVDFILEAKRVLKVGGVLKICEIKSRIESLRKFVLKLKKCSFQIEGKPESFNKLFVNFTFILKSKTDKSTVSDITLNPCLYKKR